MLWSERLVVRPGHDIGLAVRTLPQSSPTIPRRGQRSRSLPVSLSPELTIPLLVPHTADSLSRPGSHWAPLHAQESWHPRELDLAPLTSSASPTYGITASL